MDNHALLFEAERKLNLNELGVFILFYGKHAQAERARYLRTSYLEDDFIVFLKLKMRMSLEPAAAYA